MKTVKQEKVVSKKKKLPAYLLSMYRVILTRYRGGHHEGRGEGEESGQATQQRAQEEEGGMRREGAVIA